MMAIIYRRARWISLLVLVCVIVANVPPPSRGARAAEEICGTWTIAKTSDGRLTLAPYDNGSEGCATTYRIQNKTKKNIDIALPEFPLLGKQTLDIGLGGYSLTAKVSATNAVGLELVHLDGKRVPNPDALLSFIGARHTISLPDFSPLLLMTPQTAQGATTVSIEASITKESLIVDAILLILDAFVKFALGEAGSCSLNVMKMLLRGMEYGHLLENTFEIEDLLNISTLAIKLGKAIPLMVEQLLDGMVDAIEGCGVEQAILLVAKIGAKFLAKFVPVFNVIEAALAVKNLNELVADAATYLGVIAYDSFISYRDRSFTASLTYQPPAIAQPRPTNTAATRATQVPQTPIARQPTAYTITDLGTLGGVYSAAYDINNAGQIVGSSTTIASGSGAPFVSPFIWQDGRMTGLETLGIAYAINEAGQIAGQASESREPGAASYAFLYGDKRLNRIGAFGPGRVATMGINDAGQIVGSVASAQGAVAHSGVVWESGASKALPPLGEVAAVSNSGQIAGTAADQGKPQAAVLYDQRTGNVQQLGYVNPQFMSVATAINDAGVVAGSGGRSNRAWQAFIWKDGKLTPLPDLGEFRHSMAYAINRDETIVGLVSTVSPPDPSPVRKRAVMWREGRAIDLNTLLPPNSGWVLEEARGINDKGQIVGSGTINGQTHAFLLAPTHQIAYVSRDGDLWLVNTDGTDARKLVTGPLGSPSWSRDGGRLAYTRRVGQGRTAVDQIESVNADGTNGAVIVPGQQGRAIGGARWAPDNAAIYYNLSTNPSSNTDWSIVRRELATGAERVVVQHRSPLPFDVAPDGVIAFHACGLEGGVDCYLYSLDTTGRRARIFQGGNESVCCPVWSPDGRRVALVRGGIIVANRDGTGRYEIKTPDHALGGLSWSPDGASIAFGTNAAYVAVPNDIWVVPANGGTPAKRFAGLNPAWRPVPGTNPAPVPAAPAATPVAPTVTPASSPMPGLRVGGSVEVVGAGDCVNARAQPSRTAALVKCLPDGTVAVVLDGPRSADGFTWWLLDAGGWVVADYLRPASGQGAAPAPNAAATEQRLVHLLGTKSVRFASLPAGTDGLPRLVALVGGRGEDFAGEEAACAKYGAGKNTTPCLLVIRVGRTADTVLSAVDTTFSRPAVVNFCASGSPNVRVVIHLYTASARAPVPYRQEFRLTGDRLSAGTTTVLELGGKLPTELPCSEVLR
jgi:probable HAF family extracellular repeat protein